jgi:hypothetical protein
VFSTKTQQEFHNDVVVYFDATTITQEDFHNVQRMGLILQDIEKQLWVSPDVLGKYELGNIKVDIKQLNNILPRLINV